MWHPFMIVVQMQRTTSEFERVHLRALPARSSPAAPVLLVGLSKLWLLQSAAGRSLTPRATAARMEGSGHKILHCYLMLLPSASTYTIALSMKK